MPDSAVEFLQNKLTGIIKQLNYNYNEGVDLHSKLAELEKSNLALLTTFYEIQIAINKLAR